MAVVLKNVFRNSCMGYDNIQQTMNLLFKRRAYFISTIHF